MNILHNLFFCIILIISNHIVLIAQDRQLTFRNSEFAVIYKQEALESAADNNFPEAKSSLQKSLSYDPCNLEIQFYLMLANDPDRYHYLSKIKDIYGIKNESVDSLITVINSEIEDKFIKSVFSGFIFNQHKDYSLAWGSYSQAISNDSRQAYIYFLRATASMKISKYEDAIDDLTKALQLNFCSYRLYFNRGLAQYRRKNFDLAIQDYKSAMMLAPLLRKSLHNSQLICEAFNQRGIEYLKHDDFQQALNDFSYAIKIHPQFSEPYLNRGVVYRKLTQYESAIEDFNWAISLNQKYTDAYFNRALTFRDMKQIERAIRDLKTVSIIDPSHYKAYYELGNISFEQNDYYGAIEIYHKCLEIKPDYIWAYYKRAQAYDRLRKYPGAIKDYNCFYDQAPDSFLNQKVNAWERSNLLQKWLDQRK
jgi:tetratricopeptide (TPR) repeat protein